MHSNAKMISSE